MGSFASLLGGLATGARDEYSKIDEANRADKRAKDKQIADAILKDLQTNDQLTPAEQEHHFRTFLDLSGVKDKKVVDGLVNHSQYHRQKMAELDRQQGYGKQQPELGGGTPSSAGGTIPGADGAPDVTLPEMPMAPTGGLPQLPPPPEGFQPKTVGQLKFEESRDRVAQSKKDAADAARQAAREAAMGSIEDKIDILKKYDGTPMEAEVRYLVGAAPKSTAGSGVAGAFVTGNGTRGSDLIEILRRQGAPQEKLDQVDPKKLYTLTVGHDKTTVTAFYPKEESAVGTGHEASGDQVLAMGIQQDRGGAPVVKGGTYTIIHSGQGGGILGVIPTAQLATYAQQHKVNFSVTNDGIVETPYTESSSTQKGLPNTPAGGAVPQVAPPVPTGPSAPGTTASAPQGRAATPSTPLPQSPNARPTPGPPAPPNPFTDTIKPGTIIGQKPLTQGEFTNLNNAKQGLRALEKLKDKIEADPAVLLKAAIPGSPGARLFAAWKNELSDIITRLRTGAALNEEEQKFYQGQMPGLLDLVGQKVEPGLIEDKLKIYDGLFNGVLSQYGRRAASGYSPEAVRSMRVTLIAPNGEVGEFTPDKAKILLSKGARIVGK